MEIYGMLPKTLSALTLVMSLQIVYGQDTACTVNPCKNGGVCFPQPNREFFCLCVLGFTGKTCDGDIQTTSEPEGMDSTTRLIERTSMASTTTLQTTTLATTNVQTTTPRQTTTMVQTTPRQTTTRVQTTPRQTTQVITDLTATPTETDGAISTKAGSTSGEAQTEGAITSSTDSSSGEVDATSTSDSNEITVSTSRMMGDRTTPPRKTDKGPPDNETVRDRDPTFLWILFLILFAMLIIAAIITFIAVKRASKQQGKYDPSAALSAHERSSGSSNGVAAEGTINPGHTDVV